MKLSSCASYLKLLYLFIISALSLGIIFYKADVSWLGTIGLWTASALLCLWFSVIGRLLPSLVATMYTLIIIQLMNQAKIYYFKSRLFFTDFLLVLDGNNYDTLNQYWEVLIVAALLIAVIALSFYWFYQGKRYGWKIRLASLMCSMFLVFGTYQITLVPKNIAAWQEKLPNGKGVIINLWMTLQGMHYESPVFEGSNELFLQKAVEITLDKASAVKPDIVVFLQESNTDRDYFNLYKANLPKLSMFDAQADFVSGYGPLRVQTTGGGTWLSEFSFATGLDTNDFAHRKSSVFYTVAPHVQTSFYQELKNNGYFTVLLTPMTKDNYNTRQAYENFGIDLVLQPQDLGYDADMNSNLWKITSHEMLQYVQDILNQYSDKPVAVFMLSMNEHGPYDETTEDHYKIAQYFDDEKVARRLNDYLSRQEALNEATDYFAQKFLTRDRPTLFLYFGDHQPALYGKAVREDLFKDPLYVTQFVMKDNFGDEQKMVNGSLTDINFLGGLILERINAKVSTYYDANIKMRYLCNGLLNDCDDQALINSYKAHIYNVLKVADGQKNAL